jgi:hypothetical protein
VQAAGRGIIIIPLAQMRFIPGPVRFDNKIILFSEMLKFSIKYKNFRKIIIFS